MNSRELDRDVAGCAAAHQRLLATLDRLADDDVGRPSLLPGWTVGHVATHLARQADSQVRMLDAADRGEVGDQYPGGPEQRAAEIEAGAARPAEELVRDVRLAIWRLEQRWAGLSAAGWAGEGRSFGRAVPITDLPFRRWRETDVHHADLDLGYGPADWPAEYVRLELARMGMLWASRRPMGLTELPAEANLLAPHERLAWLLGRREVEGLPAPGLL